MIPRIPDWSQLQLVMPEIWLVAAMCAAILVPFVKRNSARPTCRRGGRGTDNWRYLATLSTMANSEGFGMIFSGMLAIDYFSQFF